MGIGAIALHRMINILGISTEASKAKKILKNSYLATVMKPYKIGYLATPGF